MNKGKNYFILYIFILGVMYLVCSSNQDEHKDFSQNDYEVLIPEIILKNVISFPVALYTIDEYLVLKGFGRDSIYSMYELSSLNYLGSFGHIESDPTGFEEFNLLWTVYTERFR